MLYIPLGMKSIFKILTFIFIVAGFLISREKSLNSSKIAITLKVNKYYFDVAVDDGDLLLRKRSNKRRKIKRKPRRGRDNR